MIPKFRVAFKNNILGEVGSIDFVDETVTIPVYDKLDGDYLGDNVCGLNQVTLMQSTGLFDKNGKEIFEGDIVKVMDMTLAVVKYSKARGAYYLDCGNKIGDAGLICQYDTIEVLGNIFENPESMEDMQ